MPRISVGCRSAALTVAVLLAAYPKLAGATTTTTYIGADGGSWTVPGNWDNGVPNSNAFDAVLNDLVPKTVVLSGVPENINNMTVSTPDTLNLRVGLTLDGNVVNNGTMNISGFGGLLFHANATLSGGGVINILGQSSRLDGTNGIRLSTDNVISGAGNIGTPGGGISLNNSGTITATNGGQGLFLNIYPSATSSIMNTGVLRADGGTLGLGFAFVANSGGLIESRHG